MTSFPKTVKYDYVDGTTEYVGISYTNNSTADPVWTLLKITTTGSDIDIERPTDAPKGNTNAVWDDRTTYNYG